MDFSCVFVHPTTNKQINKNKMKKKISIGCQLELICNANIFVTKYDDCTSPYDSSACSKWYYRRLAVTSYYNSSIRKSDANVYLYVYELFEARVEKNCRSNTDPHTIDLCYKICYVIKWPKNN